MTWPHQSTSVPRQPEGAAQARLGEDFGNNVSASLRVAPPLELVQTGSNVLIRLRQRRAFWARITAGMNPYGWVELIPQPSGDWLEGLARGTPTDQPAYEMSHRGDVPVGTVVWLEKPGALADEYRFQIGAVTP